MKLNINMQGLQRVQEQLRKLSEGQLRTAASKALNDAAFQLRREMQQEMQTRFDRPTPFIVRAPRVFPADEQRLSAAVMPTYRSERGTKGGKIGVDPQDVLQAQEFGGRRGDKRSEKVLRIARILPAGYQTVIPANPFPGSEDGHGNFRGSFLRSVLSYIQAFSEQGYRANMGAKRMAALRERGGTSARAAGPVMGRRFFVAYGKLRGSARFTPVTRREDERANNLPAGIWAVVGRTGADVRPVLLFVRSGRYTPRISMDRLAKSPGRQEYLERRLRYRIRQQAGV